MAEPPFEYDEVGNTLYVLVSFYALVLLPVTYYFFPTGEAAEVNKVNLREFQYHGYKDKQRKEVNEPWRRTKKIVIYVGLTLAWIIFAFLVKKMTEIEVKHEEYNPYTVLGLGQGASTAEVKKKYRKLVEIHHPSRGGDPVGFDKIAKAYQALTEEEARKNWELYGNPDGPQATIYGIALPKWLVSEEYSMWMLAFYGFILLTILLVVIVLEVKEKRPYGSVKYEYYIEYENEEEDNVLDNSEDYTEGSSNED